MLAKDRKAFRIWLMQPDASKEKRGIVEGEEEEEEDKYQLQCRADVSCTVVATAPLHTLCTQITQFLSAPSATSTQLIIVALFQTQTPQFGTQPGLQTTSLKRFVVFSPSPNGVQIVHSVASWLPPFESLANKSLICRQISCAIKTAILSVLKQNHNPSSNKEFLCITHTVEHKICL